MCGNSESVDYETGKVGDTLISTGFFLFSLKLLSINLKKLDNSRQIAPKYLLVYQILPKSISTSQGSKVNLI